MNRKLVNYLIFGAIAAIVVILTINHSRHMRYLVDLIASRSPNAPEAANELITREQFGDSITGEPQETRLAAIDALVKVGTPDAVAQFGGLLKDPEKPVRDRAIEGAVKIAAKSDDHLQKLIANIKEGDPNQKGNAVKALQLLGQNRPVALRIIPPVCAIMKKEGGARTSAGDVLGGLKNARPESIKELVPYLADKDEAVRVAAVDALGKVGSPAAIPILADQMKTTAQVRRVSIGAIALIADPSGESHLIEALRNPDEDNEARAQAATGLGRLATQQAIQTLIAALRDYDLKVQLAAVAALARVANPAIPPLQTALQHSTDQRERLRAADALGRMQKQEANPALLTALKDPDPEVRKTAATGLGWPNNAQAVPALISLLADKDGATAQTAAESLAKIGEPARLPLTAALKGPQVTAYLAAQVLAKPKAQ